MIKIVENLSEIGAGTRGASLGVGALNVVSQLSSDGYFGRYEIEQIQNENHLLNFSTDFPHAKRIDGLVKVYERTAEIISQTLKSNSFPIVLSGDHSCAGGTIAGIKQAFPNKRLGVVWIDAHADIHTPYTSPSGNIHGMPLSTALGEDNLEAKINDISEGTERHWNALKNIGDISPKIKTEDIIYIGVRDTEAPEDNYIAKHNIKNYTVDEIRQKSCKTVFDEIMNALKDCDMVYISFDVDSMDCILVSKGTGTPVEEGLTAEEANLFLNYFAAEEKVNCIEFVEINPCLDDKKNKMAETAYAILKEITVVLENRLN